MIRHTQRTASLPHKACTPSVSPHIWYIHRTREEDADDTVPAEVIAELNKVKPRRAIKKRPKLTLDILQVCGCQQHT